jgi:hypothetical protein
MAIMNEGDPRNEIERLEVQIDELAAKIESCRKFILAGATDVAQFGSSGGLTKNLRVMTSPGTA